ncbi:hypothetical protein AURDEDRAFT_178493 [Auricularia subglabra TFB-10046 SS5]|uniref:Uncharacterized protein n=1 Tax=Auricularia subglabra (strain TFB-10046 / SS5) TaxID=717982 RepID=J0CQH8_AURST|nr:hypothetical protein AURDEDRAFT_178493 [Auricularia subglabra TFB-10046 SS5]
MPLRVRPSPDAHQAPTLPDAEPDRVLLVTAYFPFSSSKHGTWDYDNWMALFLGTMHADVYMFVPPELESKVRAIRGNTGRLTVDTRWNRPHDIPPLADPKRREQLASQREKDREKKYHNADLYAVWAAKPFFVDQALKQANSNESYAFAFWMDVGTFRRPHAFKRWPDVCFLRSVYENVAQRPDAVFMPIQWTPKWGNRGWKEDDGPLDIDMAIGSVFGGTPAGLQWFNKAYFTYFYHYLDAGYFAGKDQTVWNALLMLFPDRFVTVFASDPQTMPGGKNRGQGPGDCGGWWGYYAYWLAPPHERLATEEEFFNGVRCTRIRALPLLSVLRRSLGWGWTPPRASVKLIEPPTA